MIILKYDNTLTIKFKFKNNINYELLKYNKIKKFNDEEKFKKKIRIQLV
jgi:hypothetical protein